MNETQYRILIVEDEYSIREMLRLSLEREGFFIFDCETAEEALDLVNKEVVHLALVDWMLPQMSGVDFSRRIRKTEGISHLPIIMLTAKSEEDDKLDGFDAGIDDYVSKPFSIKEVVARIYSLLRRTHNVTDNSEKISQSGITLDSSSHTVFTEHNDEIILGPTEFKLLQFLMKTPERVYSREMLLDNIWGAGVYVDERTVDVHIRRLRKALNKYNLEKVIRTVRGSGYSFTKNKKIE